MRKIPVLTSIAVFTSVMAFTSASWAEPVGTVESLDPASSSLNVKNAQGATRTVSQGADLELSDHLLPKAGQSAVLKLKDGSEVTVDSGADLSVADYVPSQAASVPHVQLDQGTAHFSVTKTATGHTTFFIRTRSATMGVRGTEFVVTQLQDGYSTVHTLEGTVRMAKSEADLDTPGKSVAVVSGKTSYLYPTMKAPSRPRIFNRKAYLDQLAKTHPGLMRQIRHVQLQRYRAELRHPERANRARAMRRAEEQRKARRKRRHLPPKKK